MSGASVRLAKRRNRPIKSPDAVGDVGEEDKENQASTGDALNKSRAPPPPRHSARLRIKAERRAKATVVERAGKQEEEEEEEDATSTSEEEEDGVHEVASILGRRERRGRVEYRVKWKRTEEVTWEPESHLTGCAQLLRAFEEENGGKDGAAGRGLRRDRGRRSQGRPPGRRPLRRGDGTQRSSPGDDGESASEAEEEGGEHGPVGVRFQCGARTEQGHRSENQDAYLVPCSASADGTSGFNMFGVLDGHGDKGRFASERGVEILRDFVPRHYGELRTGGGAHKGTSSDGRCLETALVRGLEKVDEELRLDGETCKEEYGTTAVICVQRGQYLVIANVGDSKAILFRAATGGASSRDKLSDVILTIEHKASVRREAARIWAKEGLVGKDLMVYPSKDDPHGSGLAMTRALGHAVLSKYGVIATPDLYRASLRDKDMLVIACDGLWDVLNTREVTRLVASLVKEGKEPQAIASALVERAERKWISGLGKGRVADNITVIVVVFRLA